MWHAPSPALKRVARGARYAAAVDLRRNPPLDGALRRALVDLWVEVTSAGGTVGFLAPTDADEVRPVARAAFDRVSAGRDDLVVAFADGAPVAFGFLVTNDARIARHWGTVSRLQRRPGAALRGAGGPVLDALEDQARQRALDRVVVLVRGGTGIERYYLRRGYAVDGRLPGRLKPSEGMVTEELHLSKWIGRPGAQRDGVLRVRRLDPELPLPRYAHPGDAGLDLHARCDVTLAPGERAVVPTGIAIALPPGHVGLVHPRSGLAARHGLGMVNAPGTIDEGYRGELKLTLINHDPHDAVTLHRGDRVAQLLVQRVERMELVETDDLGDTPRGTGGFGSSGR